MKTILIISRYFLGFLILLFLFFFLIYSIWFVFSTVTGKSIDGEMYQYYKLTRIEFIILNTIIAVMSVTFFIRIVYGKFVSNNNQLEKIFVQALVFVIIAVAFEFYLDTRFIGKG